VQIYQGSMNIIFWIKEINLIKKCSIKSNSMAIFSNFLHYKFKRFMFLNPINFSLIFETALNMHWKPKASKNWLNFWHQAVNINANRKKVAEQSESERNNQNVMWWPDKEILLTAQMAAGTLRALSALAESRKVR